ncbi:MAG: 3-deoxy-manno-octulosonate cytidylyltransferase [Paludibacteraceae bacterium]
MKFVGIIPARYASTRFPGKPLADIFGKPMIQHVYERASQVFDTVVVATDDDRISQAVTHFGGRVVMTATTHRTGTDRCYEAYTKLAEPFDVVVNIQGDEPFIAIEQMELLKNCFTANNVQIATLVKPFAPDTTWNELQNPNTPKVLVDAHSEAICFSRSVVPYMRGVQPDQWAAAHTFYKHIGIYAYRADVLARITHMPQGVLEQCESLEQLRWLENGLRIKVAVTTAENYSVDTPDDLAKILQLHKQIH